MTPSQRIPTLSVNIGLLLATLLTIHVLPRLASVLLLLFAGVILAVMLSALSSALRRILPFGYAFAYGVALACLILVLLIIGLAIGPQLAVQIPILTERIPSAWTELLEQLNDYALFGNVVNQASQPLHWLTHNFQILNVVSGTFGALVDIFVVLFVGVYGAAAPRRYLDFSGQLLSDARQREIATLASELGRSLRHWMLARLLTVTIVGVATALGLWLLGVPLAFTLGFVAGVLSFVPYLGPVLGCIPAALIAAVESPVLAIWVLVLFGAVHLAESTLLTPLIQQRAIAMPPAILITVQLMGGVLLGPLGVLLAAPVVVCGIAILRWHHATKTTP